MNNVQTLIAIIIIALITALLRFAPFLFFKRKVPKFVEYLGKVLPYSIMAMLAVYCLKDVNFTAASNWVPALTAAAAVVGIQIWRRNTIISVIAGTAVYMVLLRVI